MRHYAHMLHTALILSAATPALGADVWIEATPNAEWSERFLPVAVSFDDKLWVIGGGLHADGTRLNDVWYSIDGATWTPATLSAPWAPRAGHGAVVFDNKIWIMGGFGASQFSNLNDVWCSSDGVNWTEVTPSAGWSPRFGLKPIVYDDRIWILGGRASGSYRNDVWYSADGAAWTQATSNAGWPPNAGGGSTVFDGKMYMMGGWSPPAVRDDVWSSIDGVNWTLETGTPGWYPRPVYDPVVVDNKMWIIAGHNQSWPDISFNDVWNTEDGVTWTEDASSPADWPARSNHAVVVHNSTIFLLGGYDHLTDVYFNDVWYLNTVDDGDGDGIPDDSDSCLQSDLSESILIDECNTDVINELFEDGCTMSDLIHDCADAVMNHGDFVSCVAQLANEWKQNDLISGQDKGRIQSCAAQSDIGHGCISDADCDDGAFCNGVEMCLDGDCITGNPCPGQGCDEDTDECID